MAKIKISAIAKDLGVDKAEVLELLKKFGSKAKSAQSSIMDNELDIVFEYFTQKNQVEEFDFLLEKMKKQAEEKKEEPVIDDDLSDINEPIKKETRYVDTRSSNVDLERFDTEKIEELVPENIKEDKITTGKQKIKKNKKSSFEKESKEEVKAAKEKKQKPENVVVSMGDEISVGEFAEKLRVERVG